MQYPEPGQEKQKNFLKDALTTIFKHKKLILIVFGLITVGVAVAQFMISPDYEAETSLLVKMGREYMNRSEVGTSTPVMSLGQQEAMNSEIQILKSRDLIEKVIAIVKLENIYPQLLDKNSSSKANPIDHAIELFRKKLTVEDVKSSTVIRVTFKHNDPKIAAKVLNTLVEVFQEKHLMVFSDPKSSYLEMQLAVYDQKLKESENNLQTFKQQNGVFSLDEQRSLLLKQRSDLDSALKGAQNALYEMQKRTISLKEQLKSISESKIHYPPNEGDTLVNDTKSKLMTAQLNEQALSKKYTDTNRLVVNARKEVQSLKNMLKEQEDERNNRYRTANPIYQTMQMELLKNQTELSAQRGKSAALRQQIAEVDSKIRSLDYSEKEIQKLKRDLVNNEKNYQTYMEKSELARINDDMNRLKMTNVSVIQKAIVPTVPLKANKLANIAIGLLLGLVSGVAVAFIYESTLMSFSTTEKVEDNLGLPVLSSIGLKQG